MDAFFCILSYAVQTRYELNKKLIKCKLLLLEKKREKGVEKGLHSAYNLRPQLEWLLHFSVAP